jgi:hypothetical protein
MNEAAIQERELTDKLLEALQQLPQAHARLAAGSIRPDRGRFDAEVTLELGGKPVVLLVEVKKSIYPRDVRDVLWQVQQFGMLTRIKELAKPVVPMLVAESISPGAKELLKQENVGYFDTGGSLFVPAAGAYVYVDKPPPKTIAKSVRTLFQGKRSQVLHALLHERGQWFGVKSLAELAQVSPATASETLTALERFDWLASKGQGPSKERRLTEPGALLDEWSKQDLAGRPLAPRRYYVPGTEIEALTGRIAKICEARDLEYAITQEAAAQTYAPFLSAISRVTCRIAPGRSAEAAVGELEARVVTEGANLLIIETSSHAEFLFKERLGSVWLASPVQVYLDLLRAGGRAREMADHLRRERIGF